MTTHSFLASAGHNEYGVWPVPAGLTIDDLWPPEAMPEEERDGLYEMGEIEQVEVWERYNPTDGLPPDADLAWETIVRWRGETPAINAGLDVLIRQIQVRPSGDDDTFDYWPSGCRYALEVASEVGRAWEVEQVIREVLVELEEYGQELADKIGIDPPPDEWSDHRYNDAPFCAKCSGPCRSKDGRPDSAQG